MGTDSLGLGVRGERGQEELRSAVEVTQGSQVYVQRNRGVLVVGWWVVQGDDEFPIFRHLHYPVFFPPLQLIL